MKKNYIYIAILIIIFISCSKSIPTHQDSNQKINIGIILENNLSSINEAILEAVDKATNEFNEYLVSNDISYEVNAEIVYLDDNFHNAAGISDYLSQRNVMVLLGPSSCSTLYQLSNIIEFSNYIFISPSSISTLLSESNDNIVRLVPSAQYQGETTAWYMSEILGKDVLIQIWRDDIYGNDLSGIVELDFQGYNGIVFRGIEYDVGTNDFNAEIAYLRTKVSQAIQEFGKDKVVVHLIAYDEVLNILELSDQDSILSSVNWVCSDCCAKQKSLLESQKCLDFAKKTDLTAISYDVNNSPGYFILRQEIENEINHQFNDYAILAYDALWLGALAQIETSEVQSLIDAITSMNYIGLSGLITFDQFDDRAYGAYCFWKIQETENGFLWKNILVKE